MKNFSKIMRGGIFLIGLIFLIGAVATAAQSYIPTVADFSITNPDHIMGILHNVHLAPVGVSVAFNFAVLATPDDIGWEDGDEDMGGFSCVGYIGLTKHIATWPTLPDDPTTMDEMVTLVGNYAFEADKNFMKIKWSPNASNLNPESQGENVGGKSFNLKASFIVPGMKNKQCALARMLNNASGTIIFLDDEGNRINIGTEGRPVTFKPKGKSGGKAADAKEFVYEAETDSHVPGFTYNGTIILDGEVLPAITT